MDKEFVLVKENPEGNPNDAQGMLQGRILAIKELRSSGPR